MDKEFTTDGCSMWPDGPWKGCCVSHDRWYWAGGSKEKRLHADMALRKCVSNRGWPIMAWVMYVGVRIFGGPYWPTPFR